MLLKFVKLEFKREALNLNKINLRVLGLLSHCSYTIKAPRKIKNQVVNFYGEIIELPQIDTSFTIVLEEISSELNNESNITILSTIPYECPTGIGESHWKQQLEENNEMKLFWSHCSSGITENKNRLSRKSSNLSMDLAQFDEEIPTFESTIRENFKIYSPIRKKKRHQRISIRHPSIEEGVQSSPEDYEGISPEKPLLTKEQLIRKTKKQLFPSNDETIEVFLPSLSKITMQTGDPGDPSCNLNQKKPFELKIRSIPKSPCSPHSPKKLKTHKQDKKYKITIIGCIYTLIVGVIAGMVSKYISL